MKDLQEKDPANLYKEKHDFRKLVLILSLVIKIEEVDGVPEHYHMYSIIHNMDPFLVAFGVNEHDEADEPQDPINQVDCL